MFSADQKDRRKREKFDAISSSGLAFCQQRWPKNQKTDFEAILITNLHRNDFVKLENR